MAHSFLLSFIHSLRSCDVVRRDWKILTAKNALHAGRGVLVGQLVLQKTGRGNEGAIVLEMILDFKILAAVRLVNGLAWVASDGVSCWHWIYKDICIYIHIYSRFVCLGTEWSSANLWPAARAGRSSKVNTAFKQMLSRSSQTKENSKYFPSYMAVNSLHGSMEFIAENIKYVCLYIFIFILIAALAFLVLWKISCVGFVVVCTFALFINLSLSTKRIIWFESVCCIWFYKLLVLLHISYICNIFFVNFYAR